MARVLASNRILASAGVPSLVKLGFASSVTGGEGQSVVTVTNLNNSGAGSFRAAIGSDRIIKFGVQGYIDLTTDIEFDGLSNITIDGTYAPGYGVCFRLRSFILQNSSNIIIRGIRSRAGENAETIDSMRVRNCFNVVFDHCSFTQGNDGSLDINQGSHDITVQYCLVFESLGTGNSLLWEDCYNISIVKSVYGNGGRNPEWGFGDGSFVNNVIYRNFVKETADQWYENISTFDPDNPTTEMSNGSRPLQPDIIGNKWIAGDQEGVDSSKKAIYFYMDRHNSDISSAYLFQNYASGSRESDAQAQTDLARIVDNGETFQINGSAFGYHLGFTPLNPFYGGFEDAILDNAGCIYPARDGMDAAIMAGIKNRTRTTGRFGAFESVADAGGYPDLSGTLSLGTARTIATGRTLASTRALAG